MATVAVLGGGISGLSCAYYLKTLGRSQIKYLFLLEKSPKFGGWIQTTRYPDGAVFEHGPRTIRVPTRSGYNALDLVEQLDLQSRVLPVTKNHPTAKNNFILLNEKLYPMPRGDPFSFLKKTPPFSKALIRYAFDELKAERKLVDDESIYSFFQRRVGKEIADFVLDPICRGITAGDARDLSIRSMFPLIFEAEQQHGSIIKGIIKKQSNPVLDYMNSDLVKRSFNEKWKMWTLKTGLTELIDALACTVDEREFSDLIFNAKCDRISFKDNKAELSVENEKIVVDHVFSCIPSGHLAKLIPQYPILCNILNSVSTVDLAVVYLEYSDDVLNYAGFGFLSPSFENSKVLGIVFDSKCFPQLNGEGKTRLTCMIGGKWFRDILGDPDTVSEEQILKIAVDETKKHLGIQASPIRHKVVLNRSCIPQYIVGHYKKLETLETLIKENNLCLSLMGASYKGASVPDCIYNSKLTVQDYLKSS